MVLVDAVRRLFVPGAPAERVAMLHTGRCGSTVLGQLLASHGEVYWASEVFESHMAGREPVVDPRAVIEASLARARGYRIYGFETKYLSIQHLSRRCVDLDLERYLEMLGALGFSSFVILERRNLLRRAVSAEVGRQTKKWHTDRRVDRVEKVAINLARFETGAARTSLIELFELMEQERERLANLLSGSKTLNLTYEQDIEGDPLAGYARICHFLGLTPRRQTVPLKRTNPFSLREILANFDDVVTYLEGTHYAWMLDD